MNLTSSYIYLYIISLTKSYQQFHMERIYQWKFLMLLSIYFPVFGNAQKSIIPWYQSIDPTEILMSIETISSQAEVTVSDGLTYQTNSVFHDPQRAIFQRIYKDRSIVQGVEGKYVWSFDGTEEKEVSEIIGNLVLGHQFHAQILFFDKLHPFFNTPKVAKFNQQDCYVLTSENSGFKFYYRQAGYPLGMEIVRMEEENIIIKFEDWRNVSGVELPFFILIDDGSRTFRYEFQQIKFNSGSIVEFRAPEAVLTDEQKLLRHHRVIMDGHFFGLTSAMKTQQNDTMAIVSEGEIYMVQGNQPDAMIDRIMATRDYLVYDDLIRPKVEISDDGTLAWVIAQVYAAGIRYDKNGNSNGPLEFTCSWIELYEKVGENWKMSGNVSNFRPGRK